MRFREKIARFMYGRYGFDQLCRFLILAAVFFMLVGMVLRGPVYFAALALQYAALICCVVRMLSKNIYKRQQENAMYLQASLGVRRWFRSLRDRWQQRKEYKFFRCPSCHALLRVPKGRGKLQLTCRKCGNRFERKT